MFLSAGDCLCPCHAVPHCIRLQRVHQAESLAYESGLITLLPKDITLQAYEMVIESKGFWIAYANTLFYTVIGTAWSMGISLTGAYALQRKAEIPPPVELFAGVYHVVQRRYDPPVSEL